MERADEGQGRACDKVHAAAVRIAKSNAFAIGSAARYFLERLLSFHLAFYEGKSCAPLLSGGISSHPALSCKEEPKESSRFFVTEFQDRVRRNCFVAT